MTRSRSSSLLWIRPARGLYPELNSLITKDGKTDFSCGEVWRVLEVLGGWERWHVVATTLIGERGRDTWFYGCAALGRT